MITVFLIIKMFIKNKVYIITAHDSYRGIGKNNDIPWRLPEDLKFFKNCTENKTVIMGKNTFESLKKKPLKNRFNIVITRHVNYYEKKYKDSNLQFVKSLTKALKLADKQNKEIWVIGGQCVYEKILRKYKNIISSIYITEINDDFKCTSYFPYENCKYIYKTDWLISCTNLMYRHLKLKLMN